MLRALRSEIHRDVRRWMPRILLGAVLLAALAFYELLYFSVNAQLQLLRSGNAPASAVGPGGAAARIREIEETLKQIQPSHVSDMGVSIIAGLGAVMLIVFAASHMGTEFGWATLRTLLANGASRASFLGAKLASLVLFAIVFTAVGVASVVAASFLVSTQAGYDTSGLDVASIFSASWRTVYAFLPYLALASLIALWLRSSGAGIAAGLVIYFAESLVMSVLISLNKDYAAIANLGISRNVSSISRVTIRVAGDAGAPAAMLPDQTQAAFVLAVWTALFVALAFWRLRTRDITLA